MNSDLELVLVVGLLISIVVITSIIKKRYEKKMYNNGICRDCGYPLRYFDTDMDGRRGYICDACKNFYWVSYKVDKNYKESNNAN